MLSPTPLYLDFSNKLFPIEPPKEVPTSELELLELREPTLSSPQYFIKIYSPHNFNQLEGIRYSQLNFLIPTHSSLNNKVRLSLFPSIGYGINSCYKVEYWQYQRPFYPGIPRSTTKLTKQKVSEEYWRIPTVDKNYIYSYEDYYHYTPSYNYLSNVEIVRGDTTQDSLINNLDIISIKEIKSPTTKFTDYKLVDDSLFWKPYFAPIPIPGDTPPTPPSSPSVAIEWSSPSQPTEGETYQITYITPLNLAEIIYIDPQGNTTLDFPLDPLVNNFYLSHPLFFPL